MAKIKTKIIVNGKTLTVIESYEFANRTYYRVEELPHPVSERHIDKP